MVLLVATAAAVVAEALAVGLRPGFGAVLALVPRADRARALGGRRARTRCWSRRWRPPRCVVGAASGPPLRDARCAAAGVGRA